MLNERRSIMVFDGMDRMTDFVIEQWETLSSAAIKYKGHFSVALSGGSTPVHLYRKLSERKDLPWNKTNVFMVDERFVPYDSDDNNYHMINRTLLCHVKIPANNIHFISTTENTPEESAKRYEDNLLSYARKSKSQLPHIDLMLLGIGDDGHTASLFPGAPELKETKRLAVAVTAPAQSTSERITLTYHVINNAENIFFMASGLKKAEVIREIVEDNKNRLPAALVQPENGNVFFLLDKESASRLSGR